jgi:hypothetical protein
MEASINYVIDALSRLDGANLIAIFLMLYFFKKNFQEEIDKKFNDNSLVFDKRFEQMDKKFEQMDKKFEHRFDLVDKRFEQIDKKFEQIDKKFEQRFDLVDKKFEQVEIKLVDIYKKIDETNVKIAEIDKRLYGIETVLHMKDCCVLKSDQSLKKAE